MSKHTKGPWKVTTGAVFDSKDRPVAEMIRDDRAIKANIKPVERDYNAKLIAAAPDMLKLLEDLDYQFHSGGIKEVRAQDRAWFNSKHQELKYIISLARGDNDE